MRISDWSSDVCSSDLRDLLVDLGGFFLGLAGGLRAHLDVLDDAKLLVLALDDLHARLETLVRALGEGLVRLLDSLVNHALAILGLRLHGRRVDLLALLDCVAAGRQRDRFGLRLPGSVAILDFLRRHWFSPVSNNTQQKPERLR